MRQDGGVFERGGELVRIAGGRIYPALPGWLSLYATSIAKFEKFDRRCKEWRSTDCPIPLVHSLLDMSGLWDLPHLSGILTAPTITPAGRVIQTGGYDEETGLYLDLPDRTQWPGVPESPSAAELRDGMDRLWTPFRDFPFKSPKDKGAHLAALLTAVVRPLLPTAPGTLYTAPSAGSGKTLLALCLAALAGQDPEVMPSVEEDEELRKRVLAVAREGTRVIILDNLSGSLQSNALCSLLTSTRYSDRVLGASTMVSVPTSFSVLITGNNLSIVGDLNRRLLRCEIDPRWVGPVVDRRTAGADCRRPAVCTVGNSAKLRRVGNSELIRR
jgi:hypothetical protein